MLTCHCCGETHANTDHLDHNDLGWWCDCCDTFSFYDPKEHEKHRFLLLLEDKDPQPQKPASILSLPKLRKQLSPLRYPGGKSKLIDYLYTKLSKDQLDTFVEVFAGGASLGLSLLDAGIINRLILNDKDPGVFAFWQTVLESPQELTSRLLSVVPTHRDLADAKVLLSSGGPPTGELAWSFLLANRLSFSGIIKANPLGGKNGTQEDLLARWNPQKLSDRIEHIHSMADRIEIHNKDACKFLAGTAYWNTHCTCFIDPPYFVQGSKLYDTFYTENDHKELAELLERLHLEFPESDLIVTYDNHPRICELYPCAQQEVVPRSYSVRNNIKTKITPERSR